MFATKNDLKNGFDLPEAMQIRQNHSLKGRGGEADCNPTVVATPTSWIVVAVILHQVDFSEDVF